MQLNSKIISFRASDDDHHIIRHVAWSKNLSISDYLRSLTTSEIEWLRRNTNKTVINITLDKMNHI